MVRNDRKNGRFGSLLLGFLLILCNSGALFGAEQPTSSTGKKRLPIYEQWSGTGSSYPGSPVYQMIRRLEELQQFWALHGVPDPMPHINFDTCMLFVWAPGPSLFDYRPMQVLAFLREPQGLFLVLSLERKDTGGYLRGPFLMAILPKQEGHVYVTRPGHKHLHEAALMPLTTIYDMGGALIPITETTVGKGGSGAPSSGGGFGFESGSGVADGSTTNVAVTTPAAKPASEAKPPSESKPTDTGSSSGTSTGQAADAGFDAGFGEPAKPAQPVKPAAAAESSSKAKTASDSGDPFNIDF